MAFRKDGSPLRHHRFTRPGSVKDPIIVRIIGTDTNGETLARPLTWEGKQPLILMAPAARGVPALVVGECVLARLKPVGAGKFEGHTVKRLSTEPGRILGIFRQGAKGGRIRPTDRRAKAEWIVPPSETGGALDDEIVLAVPLPYHNEGLKPARVLQRLGRLGDARSVSLICLHTHDIPQVFPQSVLEEAAAAAPVPLGTREDLRDLDLITIDGDDARDFDDAVFAEDHDQGYRLIVAIADVAHYVRIGSALDREARLRGNSVYFPDHVVPMLPEALSNGWCSLRPGEDRGCLFVEIKIGHDGQKRGHRFGRGLMRSAARLTYEEIQAAFDTGGDGRVRSGRLKSLYRAFDALFSARLMRGALDLDLPERRVVLDPQGNVKEIAPQLRLNSHRLIEEFMVLANVAAADELDRLMQPCMFRVHAPPSGEKLETLCAMLRGIGVSLPSGDRVRQHDLNHVLALVAGTEQATLVNEMMLRSQSQAEYCLENIGHFGLGLARYAHFTSPIRRYADLLVHRALIRGLNLHVDSPKSDDLDPADDVAQQITATERRAAAAERDAMDRYSAAYMRDRVGEMFDARISGVAQFGLFVTVQGSGASGIVPTRSLQDDFWTFNEATQTMTGRRTRFEYRLAQKVNVRLADVSLITGSLVFKIINDVTQQRVGPKKRQKKIKLRTT